jgi:hypothetical protein
MLVYMPRDSNNLLLILVLIELRRSTRMSTVPGRAIPVIQTTESAKGHIDAESRMP